MRRLSGTVAAVSFCLTKPFSVPLFSRAIFKNGWQTNVLYGILYPVLIEDPTTEYPK